MVKAANPIPIRSKHKAISVLFPYLIRLERLGEHEILGAFLYAARVSKGVMWIRTGPFVSSLFNEASPETIVLVSPHVNWRGVGDHENAISRWVEAAMVVPYTGEVGQSVVEALLHIASFDSLRPLIPTSIWAWLKKQPTLPPECLGRPMGTKGAVVRHVRELGDTEILKSYLLVIWSEWDHISDQSGGLAEMQTTIQEDFGGIGMWRHREDLIKRLDHILKQLDWGLGHLGHHKPSLHEDDIQRAKEQYSELKRVLLDVDEEETNMLLTRMLPTATLILLVY